MEENQKYLELKNKLTIIINQYDNLIFYFYQSFATEKSNHKLLEVEAKITLFSLQIHEIFKRSFFQDIMHHLIELFPQITQTFQSLKEQGLQNIFLERTLKEWENQTIQISNLYQQTQKINFEKEYKEDRNLFFIATYKSLQTSASFQFQQEIINLQQNPYLLRNVQENIEHCQKTQQELEANNNQANNLIQQLQSTESAFIKLKEDLNIERQTIQQLMADATKLGLAQRYTQEKNTLNSEKHKWDFRFNLALFSLIGLGTLEIIVFVCSIYIEAMQKISNTPTIYLGLVPIHIAIIWFVVFFSRRRNEVNRLASDYAHKEVFASSYEAYLEEIKKLKDDEIISKEKEEEAKELATKLLDSMISVLSDNPAKSLDTKKTTDELPAKELVNFASEVIKLKGK